MKQNSKFWLKRLFSFLAIVICCLPLKAQMKPVLGYFYASEIKGKVYLSWQISAGSSCDGVKILRGTDSLHLVPIGSIPGICGSISEPLNYEFIDQNPIKNRKSYYRLELGLISSNSILSILVVDIESIGFQVRPNPMQSHGKIYFANQNNQEHYILIQNELGIMMKKYITSLDFFEIDASSLAYGMYYFLIYTKEDELILRGNFLVN